MGNEKSLNEKIEAGLSKLGDLEGYDSHAQAEGIVNELKNEINSKMMNEEELDEDTIKAIATVSKSLDISPEAFTNDYLHAMHENGHDVNNMIGKMESIIGSGSADKNIASTGSKDTSGGYEVDNFLKSIETIKRESNGNPQLEMKFLAEYVLNNAYIFTGTKKCFSYLKKYSKEVNKRLRKAKLQPPKYYEELFYFLKHKRVTETRLRKPKQQAQQDIQPQLNDLLPESAKRIPLKGNAKQQQQQAPKRDYPPIGIVIKNLKTAIKKGKRAKTNKEIEELREKVHQLLNSIDYAGLQAEDTHELLGLEEPIYKIFALKISDYRDSFFGQMVGNGFENGLTNIQRHNANLQPKDVIEQISGSEIGSPEYMQTKEMISELQDINSTKRINKNLKWLSYFGIAGMFLSFAIGLMGFHYDIVYHFPFMEAVLPSWIIWTFAFFGTGLIMALLHIPMDSLVNRKYMSVSRKLLGILLLFGLPLKVYIDYKAIVNYSNQVAEAKRQDTLKDKTKVIGSSYANIQKAKDNQEKTLARIEKQLDTYQEQLKDVLAKKKPYEDKIEKIENSRPTKNRATINWRRKQVKEARVSLEKLDSRQMSIQNHIDMLQKQQSEYMGVITKNTNKVNELLTKSEQQAKDEANARFKMMAAMLFLIELASMLKIYSEFIRNKNTPITLDVLNRINTFLNAGETIDSMGYKLSETINRANMAKGQHIQEVINHQIYGQISTEQGIIKNTQGLLKLSQENTKQSMELIKDMIEGQHAMINNQKMNTQLKLLQGGKND